MILCNKQSHQRTDTAVEGFLCINKHKGVTSRGVVNVIQRHVRPSKVGHAGTLDPLATGVLVVAIGRATKLIQYVQQMRKKYVGTFELGRTSDTEDITGKVTVHEVRTRPTLDALRKAVHTQIGTIQQRPPAFSALNINGQRAYDLARKGEQVELKPREIVVHDIEVLRYEYPKLILKIDCGSGTYVRSIGRDIGELLGCGAVMTDLERTAIGNFNVNDASSTDELNSIEKIMSASQPLSAGICQLPVVDLSEHQVQAISYGQKLKRSELAIGKDNSINSVAEFPSELAAIEAATGALVAILVETKGSFRPAVNFVAKS